MPYVLLRGFDKYLYTPVKGKETYALTRTNEYWACAGHPLNFTWKGRKSAEQYGWVGSPPQKLNGISPVLKIRGGLTIEEVMKNIDNTVFWVIVKRMSLRKPIITRAHYSKEYDHTVVLYIYPARRRVKPQLMLELIVSGAPMYTLRKILNKTYREVEPEKLLSAPKQYTWAGEWYSWKYFYATIILLTEAVEDENRDRP